MKRFVVESPFWELFPEAKIGVVVCKGIDNAIGYEYVLREMLADGENKAAEYLTAEEFSSNAVIRVWRDAFQKFKTFKGARSSVEALLKRTQNGKGVGCINPLVDIYNSVSLSFALPCGGEDLDAIAGNLRLTKAVGDEPFITLGSDESDPPLPGEIVYKDDAGAVCRCLNWRESTRTMLHGHTKNAILCIESVDPGRYEDLQSAVSELHYRAVRLLGGECTPYIVDRSNPEIEIG